jgi:hypothetical protein
VPALELAVVIADVVVVLRVPLLQASSSDSV